MPVTKQSNINCDTLDDFGDRILELEEKVFHAKEYQEQGDPDLMLIELEAMKEQQHKEMR